MSAPETLSDALADGWSDEDFYSSEPCIEFPSERVREMYRELGPLDDGERMAAENGRPLSSAVVEVRRGA